MRIRTALILCAGFGKRLSPLTLETPKPLLKIKNTTILENCINLISKLGIKKILINTFHLGDQINEFIKTKNFEVDIKIKEDGKNILDTGGGIMNLVKDTTDQDFLVFNPDTLWNYKYVDEINEMQDFYFSNKLNCILLVADKKLSFDKSFNLITPGIRLKKDNADDQNRIMEPLEAIQSGSTKIVVGRAITKSKDPYSTFLNICSQIS